MSWSAGCGGLRRAMVEAVTKIRPGLPPFTVKSTSPILAFTFNRPVESINCLAQIRKQSPFGYWFCPPFSQRESDSTWLRFDVLIIEKSGRRPVRDGRRLLHLRYIYTHNFVQSSIHEWYRPLGSELPLSVYSITPLLFERNMNTATLICGVASRRPQAASSQ